MQALMCRFGADSHCWFHRCARTNSWVLADPSPGGGEAARWGGLTWNDVQAKCTGVFRTREKTLGTFKPCLFVFRSSTVQAKQQVEDGGGRGRDEGEGVWGVGSSGGEEEVMSKVHALLEKLETQIDAQNDDGGAIVTDVLESMVSMQAAHRLLFPTPLPR